jgi:plastocyanin
MTVTRLVVLGTVAILLSACGTSTGSPSASTAASTASPTSASPATANMVKAINFSFQPGTLSVKAGTAVTFQNADSTTHTFTANGGAFDSGDVSPGQSFSFTFSTAGSFAFHCKIHSSMTGVITVTS